MATPLRIEIEYSVWEVAMTINPEQKTEFRSVWIKTAEQQLFHELETEYLYIGYFSNYVRSLTHIMHKISYKINMLQSILIMKANIYFIYKKYNM